MIEFQEVTRIYRSPLRRPVRAVEGFSLAVPRGEVLGLAGPNGAGKSTLIALLLGFLSPTSGRVTIDGREPRAYIEANGIGYLSELVAIPPKWTLRDALARYAVLAGVPDDRVRERVDAVIAQLGLEEHRDKRVKQLSKGNLQRTGLAQALLRDEPILVLDEPTHGLDPVWTQRFRDLVLALRRADRTIVVASHNLDELERVADRVAIIDRGRLQRVVDVRAAGAAGAARWRLLVPVRPELVPEFFPDARALGGDAFETGALELDALNRGLGGLIARGARVGAVLPAHSALERQFREAVGEDAGS